MSYSNPIQGVTSTSNTKTNISTTAYNFNDGAAQSGTASTIVLAAGASSSNDIYNNLVIQIQFGTGEGQRRIISDYVGSTKTATITPDWIDIPDSTSIYIIHINSGVIQQSTFEDLILNNASSIDDFYNDNYIAITNGTGVGQIRRIIDYTGASKTARLDNKWVIFPDDTSYYEIYGESGTAASGTSNTIVLDGNQTLAVIVGLCIEIVAGTGAGQSREIQTLVTNTVTTTSNWTVTPDSTSIYIIFGGWGGSYEIVNTYSMITVVGIIDNLNEEIGILATIFSFDVNGLQSRTKYVEISHKSETSAHTYSVVSEYCKVTIIGCGTTLNGAIQTLLHKNKSKHLTSFINEPISDQNDVELTRSILVGRTPGGIYKNLGSDVKGDINVNIASPTTSFGELKVQTPTPLAQVSFPYGINDRDVEQFVNPPVTLSMDLEGTAGLAQIQSIFLPAGSIYNQSGSASYFFLYSATDATTYYVWFSVGTSADPTPGGTGIQISINVSDTPSQVAAITQTAIHANIDFSATVPLGNIVTITNAAVGVTTSIELANMPTTSESTITSGEGMAILTTGDGVDSGIGDYSVLRTRRSMRYRAGLGSNIRFTAVFNEPLAGSGQQAGLFSIIGALVFGYDNTNFGIMRKSDGAAEVRELTISAGSTAIETATVTIDGVDLKIPLTDASGDAIITANDIASFNFRPYKFSVSAVGDTVIFLGTTDDPRSKTYAFSSGTAAGSFAQITAGLKSTLDWTYQEQWNIDRMDGFGPSGQRLNPQNGNVYEIDYQWLGFGAITFHVENSETGLLSPIHTIKYANSAKVPSLTMPHMTAGWIVWNTASTTSLTIKASSISLFVQGFIIRFDPQYGTIAGATTIAASILPVISIKNLQVYNGLPNQSEIFLEFLSINIDGNKPANIFLYRGATLITGSSHSDFQYNDKGLSVALIDTNSTEMTGGSLVFSTVVGGNESIIINLSKLNILLQKNEIFTLAAQRTTGTNVTVNISLNWVEDQ